ncbi:MAG: heterocyst-inhibiting protein PatX [Microcoleus sp.]
MQNYTFLPVLGVLSAKVDRVFSSLVELLEIATANYIFSAQTQQNGDRSPERGSGRREFHLLQAF